MQPNVMIIAVDKLNDGTTTDESFNRYEEYLNRSVYIGVGHTPDARNTLAMYRTFPTKSGNFKGVAKSSIKLTKDHAVPGVDGVSSLTSPVIIEVNFSVPVGVSAADVKICRQRLIAALDSDEICDALNIQLMV